MPCTESRRQANQRNAQKSTGPKTEAGKLASRLNSLTHGMRSEHGLVPPHLTEAVARHHQMLIDAYHPETDNQRWLLGQVADAAAKLDYCQFMIRAQIDDMADRADLCWDEDRCRAVEEIAARLPKDPSRTASRLRETSQGCRWILARWDALSVPLMENTPWNEDQCNLAASLMGVDSDLRASHPTLNPSADAADQAALMREQADAVHILMAESLEPLDAKQRELTRLGFPLRPSKELLRFERYEARLRKVYNNAMQSFRQARAERVIEPEPTTRLKPEPITCLEPEPEFLPAIEAKPIEPSTPLDVDKPIMSMLTAFVESIANGTPTPPVVTRHLSETLSKPAAPLNRKARRAREKAARKLRTVAG